MSLSGLDFCQSCLQPPNLPPPPPPPCDLGANAKKAQCHCSYERKKIITQLSRRCHASEPALSRANLSGIDVLLMSRTSKQGPINLRRLLTQKLRRGKKEGKTCITKRRGLKLNQQVHNMPFKLQEPPKGQSCSGLRTNNEM